MLTHVYTEIPLTMENLRVYPAIDVRLHEQTERFIAHVIAERPGAVRLEGPARRIESRLATLRDLVVYAWPVYVPDLPWDALNFIHRE